MTMTPSDKAGKKKTQRKSLPEDDEGRAGSERRSKQHKDSPRQPPSTSSVPASVRGRASSAESRIIRPTPRSCDTSSTAADAASKKQVHEGSLFCLYPELGEETLAKAAQSNQDLMHLLRPVVNGDPLPKKTTKGRAKSTATSSSSASTKAERQDDAGVSKTSQPARHTRHNPASSRPPSARSHRRRGSSASSSSDIRGVPAPAMEVRRDSAMDTGVDTDDDADRRSSRRLRTQASAKAKPERTRGPSKQQLTQQPSPREPDSTRVPQEDVEQTKKPDGLRQQRTPHSVVLDVTPLRGGGGRTTGGSDVVGGDDGEHGGGPSSPVLHSPMSAGTIVGSSKGATASAAMSAAGRAAVSTSRGASQNPSPKQQQQQQQQQQQSATNTPAHFASSSPSRQPPPPPAAPTTSRPNPTELTEVSAAESKQAPHSTGTKKSDAKPSTSVPPTSTLASTDSVDKPAKPPTPEPLPHARDLVGRLLVVDTLEKDILRAVVLRAFGARNVIVQYEDTAKEKMSVAEALALQAPSGETVASPTAWIKQAIQEYKDRRQREETERREIGPSNIVSGRRERAKPKPDSAESTADKSSAADNKRPKVRRGNKKERRQSGNSSGVILRHVDRARINDVDVCIGSFIVVARARAMRIHEILGMFDYASVIVFALSSYVLNPRDKRELLPVPKTLEFLALDPRDVVGRLDVVSFYGYCAQWAKIKAQQELGRHVDTSYMDHVRFLRVPNENKSNAEFLGKSTDDIAKACARAFRQAVRD
ncbi:hypothetical protein PTSG_06868 [Salpingoeca rosetta]|uniref:Uncharacterized protein n=1 Tax=Salpingoeca rosetta (strain ATCC 50818 / BSB-021) TaxID=946362 RepID=F2UF15_SALR5|nr:uncharacterized protein PTSG_06868 [Salpingoeca rosetta]EGD75215.1 hypothetical protein PTSG_06868 [Salpingoeca rosetta]|eukprot:XP_004992268.1 hypothetical protein PTSG_06868 [Salpingoeca rosetta]